MDIIVARSRCVLEFVAWVREAQPTLLLRDQLQSLLDLPYLGPRNLLEHSSVSHEDERGPELDAE